MESYPALYIPASDLLASLPRETPNRFVVGGSTHANFCVSDLAWSGELVYGNAQAAAKR